MRTQYKIIILFLIFKVSLVFGQTNQDILVENKSWNIVNYNPSQGPNCIWQTYEIRLAGDTIIGNSEYKIVKQSEFGSQPENWAVVGFIREDSTNLINSQIDLFRSQTTLNKGNARFPILYVTMATSASRKPALTFILCILTSHYEKLMNYSG